MLETMTQIAIVTFLRENEHLNDSFFQFVKKIRALKTFSCAFYVFAEVEDFASIEQKQVFNQFFIQPRATKISRINQLLQTISCDWLLCMDSDIEPDAEILCDFLCKATESSCDLAWGRIACHPCDSLIPQLVETDKIISHCFFRPFLWNLHLGISVPGQIMLLRCQTFVDAIHYDTFLDDAALGIYMRQHHLKTFRQSVVLGYETPSPTLGILFSQRSRWAKGYASLLKNNKTNRMLFYILIHGFAYHLLIPVFTILLCVFAFSCPVIMAGALLFFALILSWGRWYLFPASVLYPFIFTILHVWWAACLVKNLVTPNGKSPKTHD